MKNIKTILALFVVTVMIFIACEPDDDFIESSDAKLEFSMDTVAFDTVFTTLGSTTLDFRVYNPYNKTIKISRLELAGGDDSPFTLNVDGMAGNAFTDLEIHSKDSMYVFVRITLDPTEENLPFVVKDSIIFETNTNLQDVNLEAWGQNANFYKNVLLQGQHVWTADRPHVVYGYLIVDDTLSSSLTIEAGAQVYMHDDAIIAVDSSASLIIDGSFTDPVTIQGDRLEQWYDDIPGQWSSIWLAPGSVNNVINHAIIRNGVIGIRVDTLGASTEPTLSLTNSIIHNMQGYGLLAQGSHVVARNTVFSNCGEHAVILNIGGTYDFRHCTIGNYYDAGSRETASLALNNYYIYDEDTIARPLEKAYFGNCIVYGDEEEELILSKTTLTDFNYQFEYTLIKTETDLAADEFSHCFNDDPIFRDPSVYDFRLDTIISPAVDKGSLEVISQTDDFNLNYDMDGNIRILDIPDVGAYEFVEDGE